MKQKLLTKSGKSKIVPFLGVLLVIVLFSVLTKGALLSPKNLESLVNQTVYVVLGAVGVLFVMSMGEMDFSLGSVILIAATIGSLALKTAPALFFPICICFATFAGFLNGVFVAKLRLPSFIATLSASFIWKGLSQIILGGTASLPYSMHKLDSMFIKAALMLISLIVCYLVFEYSIYGKHCKTIGTSLEVSEQSGLSKKIIAKDKIIAFTISGFMCGIVAIMSSVRVCMVSPASTGSGQEFNVLIALMVGGISMSGGWSTKFVSIISGSLFVAILMLGMSLMNFDVYLQQAVKGVIFIIAVILSFDRKDEIIV